MAIRRLALVMALLIAPDLVVAQSAPGSAKKTSRSVQPEARAASRIRSAASSASSSAAPWTV